MAKDIRIVIEGEDKLSPIAKKAAAALENLQKDISKLDSKILGSKAKIRDLQTAKGLAKGGIFNTDILGSKKLKSELDSLIAKYKQLNAQKAAAPYGQRSAFTGQIQGVQAQISGVYARAINQQKRAIDSLAASKRKILGLRKESINLLNKQSKAQRNVTVTTSGMTNQLVRHIRQLESFVVAMYAMKKAYDATLGVGHDFNVLLENEKRGLAALILTKLQHVDATGKQVSITQRWAQANRMAEGSFKRLLDINRRTPHDLGQTIQIFRVIAGTSAQYTGSLEKLYKLTELISIGAASAGVQFQPLLASIDGLATGTVKANSDLGKFLTSIGVTNEKLKEFTSGSERIDFILSKLKDFVIAGKAVQKSWDGVTSNFRTQWSILMGEIQKPIEIKLKKEIIAFTEYLKANKDEIVGAIREIVKGFHELKPAIEGVLVAYTASKVVGWMGSLRDSLVEVTIAQRAFNIAAKSNPYIIAASAVAGAIAYVTAKMDELAEKNMKLADIQLRQQEKAELKDIGTGKFLDKKLKQLEAYNKVVVKLYESGALKGRVLETWLGNYDRLGDMISLAAKDTAVLSKETEEIPIDKVDELADRYKELMKLIGKTDKDPYAVLLRKYNDFKEKFRSEMKKDPRFGEAINKWYENQLDSLNQDTIRKYQDNENRRLEAIYRSQEEALRKTKDFYRESGQLQKAWLIEEYELRQKYKGYEGEDLEKLIQKRKDSYFDVKNQAKETANAIYEAFKGAARAMQNSMDSFFDITSQKFLDFGELAKSVLKEIYMQMVRVNITTPVVSSLANAIPFANGGVVQAYASGGVVESPTIFPMATGIGLMGEAGAEAIMPLTRIGGDLGVKATPSNVIINVKNETGLPVDMEKIGESMSDDGSRIIEVVMRNAQTNPEFRAVMGIK